ncbi:hypothetical protein OSB04_026735 [Centaurea solstitialis]|uniref:Pre-rRNA-processing protein RIX1 N-terminal domain-containing protein n=1 Tax=Centaurea solstitialis TaxID=347529 RepID=A0AA38W7I7_9ASTR|nr:hypothetical protein OSB04_026735 [Centaurea solstitialis]
MAAFDHIQSMNDVALKARLLRSLIKERIPDEKQQLRNPLELSHVVSAIKTHQLISERLLQSDDDNKKLIEKWKSAVDSWIERLLLLASSNMPDKCWAGISLLGVTCEECSSERFLASYSVWFQKLLSHLQPPAESHFVKAACCVTISDLLTRLSGYPNMKKDGTSHAAKLVQPVLKLMQEDSSDAEGAVSLLCTILSFFPSSVQKNYDSAEAAIVTKLMSGKCNANMLKKLALCLSLLPKSRGDEDSWSLMMQKILLAINLLLNDSFQGLEEETTTKEAMRALVPPGKDPPPPLGGLTILDISNKATRPERLFMPSISALLLCCSTMLKTSYPVQINVPVRSLLMLAGRVLMVDGSLPHTLYPIMTAMQQECICAELPLQHSYSLDILCGVVKEARSQLFPHAAHIIRLVTEYFKRCAFPELRIKVYALVKLMLMSMGVGVTMYIAEDIVSNASADLDSVGDLGGESSSGSVLKTSEAVPQPMQKKRKHDMTITSSGNQSQTTSLHNNPAPISVRIAALEALETLLTVGGGASRSGGWRSKVDVLLITVSTDACKGGWAKQETYAYTLPDSKPSWADFQLASLRALLASLLSPGRIRPPYLAEGLELFRRGMRETGTKVADFCAHALLTLEVLIHPRTLPLIDIASSFEYPVNGVNDGFMGNDTYSGAKKHHLYSGGTSRNGPEYPESEEDDLYEKWVNDGDGSNPPVTEQENNMVVEKTSPPAEPLVSIEGPSGSKAPEDKGKGILVEEVDKVSEIPSQTDDRHATDMETEVAAATGGDLEMAAGRSFAAVSGSEGGKELMFALGDDDKLMDEIPDIVDVEPDSDEE